MKRVLPIMASVSLLAFSAGCSNTDSAETTKKPAKQSSMKKTAKKIETSEEQLNRRAQEWLMLLRNLPPNKETAVNKICSYLAPSEDQKTRAEDYFRSWTEKDEGEPTIISSTVESVQIKTSDTAIVKYKDLCRADNGTEGTAIDRVAWQKIKGTWYRSGRADSKLGESVTVGKTRWIITSPERRSEIPTSFGETQKPGGVYIVVDCSVEFLNQEGGVIFSNNLKLTDAKGRSFSPAEGMAYPGSPIFGKRMNPNVPMTGKAVFDVATDATGLVIEIVDEDPKSIDSARVDLEI